MSARVTLCAAMSVAPAMACAAGAAGAQGDTVKLKPGLWRITSQVWLDGKEVLSDVDADGARVLLQPPWSSDTTNLRTSLNGHSLDYRCSTRAHALDEGQARFEAITERRYRIEIEGHSHMVDMDIGRPMEPRLNSTRGLTTGSGQAASCLPGVCD